MKCHSKIIRKLHKPPKPNKKPPTHIQSNKYHQTFNIASQNSSYAKKFGKEQQDDLKRVLDNHNMHKITSTCKDHKSHQQ
ncbi:hypothetical protein Sjap_020737 [Stephania japonica]|uniref:Uncharacterized protein n=1 Tax=Stephania japonica TaxID=461633 RepID=A0AAP0HVU7_9MAGN